MRIIKTEDGSDTLYSNVAGQTYHSTFGAIQESQWIFIDRGLKHFINQHPEQQTINVLEIGFGTGLNALLAEKCIEKTDTSIEFTTIELYPLEKQLYTKLNYGEITDSTDILLKLHEAEWNDAPVAITEHFSIRKIKADIVETLNEMAENEYWQKYFDVILFDAFSPDAQPELWNNKIFGNIYAITRPDGLIVTYCAKGDVRRTMISAGFTMEKLQGPPGKRHILRGTKQY